MQCPVMRECVKRTVSRYKAKLEMCSFSTEMASEQA